MKTFRMEISFTSPDFPKKLFLYQISMKIYRLKQQQTKENEKGETFLRKMMLFKSESHPKIEMMMNISQKKQK